MQNFVIDGEQQADLNDVGQDQFELAYEQQTEEYFIEDTAFSSSSDQSCSEHGDSPKGGESFQQASCEPSNSHQDSNTFKDVTSKPQEAFNRALLTEDMLERLHSFESWETHAQQGVSFCYGIRQGVDVEVRIVRKADGGLELVLQGNAKLTRHELQQTRYRIEQALQNAGLPLSSTTLGMQND